MFVKVKGLSREGKQNKKKNKMVVHSNDLKNQDVFSINPATTKRKKNDIRKSRKQKITSILEG